MHGVLCSLVIAQDPIGDREATVAVGVDELAEGDVVASSRSFHQWRPHGPLVCDARYWALHH